MYKVTIRVASAVQPALVAFRDGVDAPWQTAEAIDTGRYEIEVHGPYTAEVVCANASGAATLELSRTTDDPRDLDMSCLFGTTVDRTSHVTGTMLQGGVVAVGPGTDLGGAGVWQFDVATIDGTFDMIARTPAQDAANDRIVIRRDLAVSGATTVTPAIDVALEGISTVALPLTVTNLLPGETINAGSTLRTRSTSSNLSFPGRSMVHVLPDGALRSSDTQFITVTAGQAIALRSSFRSIRRQRLADGSTTFDLPAALAVQYAVTGDRVAATWSALPPYDLIRTGIGQTSEDNTRTVVHWTELSARYVAAAGISSAPFHSDLPGFDAAWRIDFARPWGRDFSATSTTATDLVSSSLVEDVVPDGASIAQPRHSRLLR